MYKGHSDDRDRKRGCGSKIDRSEKDYVHAFRAILRLNFKLYMYIPLYTVVRV